MKFLKKAKWILEKRKKKTIRTDVVSWSEMEVELIEQRSEVSSWGPRNYLSKGWTIQNTCFPGGTSSQEPTCQCRRCGFDLWVGQIPWRRAWQPTPGFLPGESHGEEPGGLQSVGSQSVGHDWSDWERTYTNCLKQLLNHKLHKCVFSCFGRIFWNLRD